MLALVKQQEPMMSSREIAELTGKEHKNVLADIRKMLAEIQSAEKSAEYIDGKGRPQPMILLTKEESLCLVAGYSAVIRMSIIKRWQELESANQFRIPQSLPEALQLAADLAKQNEQVSQQLAIAAPKAEFADHIALAKKGVLLGQFAKTIGMGPNTIFRVLREMGVLMQSGSNYNMPYQEFIDRSYFTIKQGTFELRSEIKISHTPLITGKGEIWLRKKLLDAGYLKAVAV
ncbi:TPA: phage antirepressor KilAC domain-containing protein [Vibrio vulnificus]|nr:phage antirepressor KilAC domain-containing protein [Vibrio vulnificus]HDY8080493.1 phage antirepressor KilAC domain-containing protein [Vibrio vulnificus]HDY8191283.1 phage antirepressor KilAC domain-containing protein [Vibrio vulnificus]